MNPWGARPSVFGCAFGHAPRSQAIWACAFGIDPAAARPPMAWAKPFAGALQMSDWAGGAIESDPLENFVAFGSGAREWLARSGRAELGGSEAFGLAMAEAAVDYLADRYGAPRARFASLCWSARAPELGQVLVQATVAKRLILAQWEADQMALGLPWGAPSDPARL